MSFRVLVAVAVLTAVGLCLVSAPAVARRGGDGRYDGGWNYCAAYADRARQRAGSDSPMAWNPNQWRSSLMPDYSRASDRCVRRRLTLREEVHIEILRDETPATDRPAASARPQVRVFGEANNRLGARAGAARRLTEPCGRSAPLILIWNGARAERACAPVGAWRGRIMAPSADLSLDKG